MTPIERARAALSANLKAQADRLGFISSDAGRYPVLDGCFDMDGATRAVIAAIREPSEAMVEAAYLAAADGDVERSSDPWPILIDALLEEGE